MLNFLEWISDWQEDSILPSEATVLPGLPLLLFSFMASFQESSKTKTCFVGISLVKIGSEDLLNSLKWLHLNCKL